MSPPRAPKPGQTRRLLWPFAGMLLSSIALQAASLVAVLEIDAGLARSQQQVTVAASQHMLVEQLTNATYLAIVGLTTSDWELLLRQQGIVQGLTERFTSMNVAMLQGGRVRLGELEVQVAPVEEPRARAALTDAQALWDKAYQAHVRVLRSENRSLKQNPDLEQFRAATERLNDALGRVSALIHQRAQVERVQYSRIQRVIPIGAFLLTLIMFAFVLGRILLPFVRSTEELARSEGQLRRARDELEQRVAERTEELAHANEALRHAHDDLEVRVKERTQELRETQRRAVELARQAGMAELATNVLHNVGNVLNSLNTSSTILSERLQAQRVESIVKIAQLLEEHRGQLGAFVTSDDRGRRLPEYLGKLGQHLSNERKEMLDMAAGLQRHVEHVRMIVELQQNYATASSFVEATSLEELLEDAIRVSGPALGRHGIALERQYIPLPRLMLDKHRMLQILLNLISNAKYAMQDTPPEQRRLTLTIERPTEERVRVRVKDNGMGIAPELLTKIFQHGFTTRKDGHGFGLHSCAIAARALGGSLEAHSDGPGKGATFTLEIPLRFEAQGGARAAS